MAEGLADLGAFLPFFLLVDGVVGVGSNWIINFCQLNPVTMLLSFCLGVAYLKVRNSWQRVGLVWNLMISFVDGVALLVYSYLHKNNDDNSISKESKES